MPIPALPVAHQPLQALQASLPQPLLLAAAGSMRAGASVLTQTECVTLGKGSPSLFPCLNWGIRSMKQGYGPQHYPLLCGWKCYSPQSAA